MSRVAIATISLNALTHNLSVARRMAMGKKLLAVVKANAYGHGLLNVAKVLQDVDGFAVAHLEEAETLRQVYPHKPIVILQGFVDETELSVLCDLTVEPVVHSFYQIALLEKQTLPDNYRVWVKIDTGMGRLGFSPDTFAEAWSRLNKLSQIQGRVCLMSHLANADDVDHPHTSQQLSLFKSLTANLIAEKSVANSAGLMAWPNSHYQWVRPGIMLYGVSPLLNQRGDDLGLKPVMTLQSQVIALNPIKKGQVVGYGSHWTARKNTCVAVIGCGYGDGYPRHVAEDTCVLIQGQQYPIVGRVSMDMLCVDVGENVSLHIGDCVTLWGEGLPVEYVATQAGTIAYELLCQVTSRVRIKKTGMVIRGKK